MRHALGIEYDGSGFLGWQRLSHGPTVQTALETALSAVADHPVEAVCSGRTDAGVHALCQVVHFDSEAPRSPRAWTMGCNSLLPAGVSVLWVQTVDAGFHARYAAQARRYRYRILNRPVRAGLYARYLTWERRPLDAARMHAAAQALVGEHDFSAFRSSQCQAPHARRHLQQITVSRDGDEVIVDVQANAFLHHMVRNIVGSLMPVGRGERPVAWIGELLAGRNRDAAGPTALPNGLAFIGPRYPAEWGLPPDVTL